MTPSPSSEVVRAARGSAADGEIKRAYVRRMFAAVAPRYDLLNHLLSLNLDRRWRRAAVARLGWEARPDGVYLDLCAGTMDLAAALAREPRFRGRVIGADFVVPMLELGRGKSARAAPVAAIGRAVSKHRDAYTYLPESVKTFPEPEALAARMRAAGFADVRFELLAGGICAVHHGTR